MRIGEDSEQVVGNLSGAELKSFYSGGGSGKAGPPNPQKRRRVEDSNEDGEADWADDGYDEQVGSSGTEAVSDYEEDYPESPPLKTGLAP